jgi:DNA-binding NarL/FixJ family response regulator
MSGLDAIISIRSEQPSARIIVLTTYAGDVLASGYANKAISAHLDINEETTKTHIKNVLAKLGARDRTHAVSLGLKRGIILL